MVLLLPLRNMVLWGGHVRVPVPSSPFARRVPHVSAHSPKTCWLGQLETQSACRCECVCQITCMLAEHEHEEKVGMFFACSQHSKESELNRIMWLPYLTTFEWCHSLCRINMFLDSMFGKTTFSADPSKRLLPLDSRTSLGGAQYMLLWSENV